MVGILVRDAANTQRTLTGLKARDGAGTLRDITSIYVRDENAVSRLVFNPSGSLTIAVVSTPDFVGGLGNGSGTVETDTTTAVASNGTAPYTYAWTLVDHTAAIDPTPGSSATAATTFIQTGMAPATFESATWRVTATDALSNTATFDVTSSFSEP